MDFRKIDFKNLNYKNILKGAINAHFLKPSERTLSRKEICRACPNRTIIQDEEQSEEKPKDNLGQCLLCGCKLNWKTTVIEECCPVNKWLDAKRSKMKGGFSIVNVDTVAYSLHYEQSENTFAVFVKDFDLVFVFLFVNNEKELGTIKMVNPRDCSTDFKAGFISSFSSKEYKIDKITENSEITFEFKVGDNIEQYRLKFFKEKQ
jgi:hypothetical protein